MTIMKEGLSFFNTRGKKKEVFAPEKPPKVTLYTCGPTVYDFVHIGNLRAFVFSDVLKRTLMHVGFSVNHTMNVTDFGHLTDDADTGEDKMVIALKREGRPMTIANMRDVSDTYIEAFKNDLALLNIIPPTKLTRASDYVKEQIALIQTLEEKGYTYEIDDGLYFDISRFSTYGELGNVDISKLKEGARVEVNSAKKHPADFALWKKGHLGWESAWGKGFPGWHIECTAMAFATLGKQIDIHTGGIDLIPTHHNGEIAQAEAATGKSPYVKFWMHSEFITIDDTKISKSLGNTITLAQLADRGFSGDTYRYWLLTGHYRSPMNFTFEALEGAKQALFRLKRHVVEDYSNKTGSVSERHETEFHKAIRDDLDTPRAIAICWDVVKDGTLTDGDKGATLKHFDSVLGIGLSDKDSESKRSLGILTDSEIPKDVQALIEERENARKNKDWDGADSIRKTINLKGYLLEDTSSGPKVTKA